MLEPSSLILQAAEQLERSSSSPSTNLNETSSSQIPSSSTEFCYTPNLDDLEQQQRIYDVAEIMARIGYGNNENKNGLSKKEQRQQLLTNAVALSSFSSTSPTNSIANPHSSHLHPHSHPLSHSSTSSGPSSSLLHSSSSTTGLTPHQMLPISSPSASIASINAALGPIIPLPQPAHPNPNTVMLTKRKKEVYMTRDDWEDSSIIAIECLKLNTKTEVTLAHFALELETRCTVKNNGIRVFMIFPWFHMKNIRFRQSLKRDGRLGPTIEKVIDAVNYFVRRDGKDYTEAELQFLLNYYKKMEVPEPSRCLTTIVEVYSEFKKFQDEIYRTNSQSEVMKILLDQSRLIEDLSHQVESLRHEIEILRDTTMSDFPDAKRRRGG